MELDYGAWQDKTFGDLTSLPEWSEFHQMKSMARTPDGESLMDVQFRIVQGTKAICEAHPDSTVAIVSHAEPIRILIAHCLGIALDLILRVEISPASVSMLQIGTQHCTVQCLNCTEEFAL